MPKLTWRTEKRKISDLVPFPDNPRRLTDKQFSDLKKSITKFDLAEIPAVDTDNKIIAGHQRLKVMQALGRGDETIDVRVPSRKLTDAEFMEYNLRSNKNTGEWDFDILANWDEGMLKDVGFDVELDKIYGKNIPPEADDVPEARKETDIKIGDVFTLGSHRVMCGDSTDTEQVARLMGGGIECSVLTDPPYNIGFKYNGIDDKKEAGQYQEFIDKYFAVLQGLTPIGMIITPGPQNHRLYEKPKDTGYWIKRNATAGASVFHYRRIEPILFYGKFCKKPNEDFFEYSSGFTKELKESQEKNGCLKAHAPAKPVELWKDLAGMTSGILIDLFLGNGTTLIACETINRICYGMEIDPIYVQVIIDRWEKLTGQKAVKVNEKAT